MARVLSAPCRKEYVSRREIVLLGGAHGHDPFHIISISLSDDEFITFVKLTWCQALHLDYVM